MVSHMRNDSPGNARQLGKFLDKYQKVTVLSGAGISTASGIPDYRDRNGKWKDAQPVQYADFIGSEKTRRRYWARSYAGWQRFSSAQPNAAHSALAILEEAGKVGCLITQNVDELHHQAGSRNVIELHGVLSRVRCLSCDGIQARTDWQSRLQAANPGWYSEVAAYRPDGDAILDANAYETFHVPACESCDGVIKPDVVFFGESVPKARVAAGLSAVEDNDALLIVGSSLMVFSGYRFARRAAELDKPIAILNQGKTRADDMADLKIDDDCLAVLTQTATRCA